LAPIVESLEGIAAKKELRPKSAWLFFLADKMAAVKKGAGGDCKTFKACGALWKTMTAKQKEPFTKMHDDEKAKSNAVKKDFSKTFDKHWADLEKHLEAEDDLTQARIKRRAEDKKGQQAMTKKLRAEKKKKMARKTKRAPLRASAVARTGAVRSSSTSEIAKLSRGLDMDVWEVRESTRSMGFFYYFNKRTRQSTADRPKNSRSAPGSTPMAGPRKGRRT